MVAPRIASVTVSLRPIAIEDLDKALAIIIEHNVQYNRNFAKEGHGWWT